MVEQEKEALLHRETVLRHMADMILGINCPSCEADKRLLENLTRLYKEKEDKNGKYNLRSVKRKV
jgi:hypothetical protein